MKRRHRDLRLLVLGSSVGVRRSSSAPPASSAAPLSGGLPAPDGHGVGGAQHPQVVGVQRATILALLEETSCAFLGLEHQAPMSNTVLQLYDEKKCSNVCMYNMNM